TTMSRIVLLPKAVYAAAGGVTPVRTAMPMASTDAVRIGSAPTTTAKIVPAKIANRRHACTVSGSGGVENQMPSADETVAIRAINERRGVGGMRDTDTT